MATTLSHVPAHPLRDTLTAPFRAIGRFMVLIMENNSRVKRVAHLNAMSDEQLAALGIKRDEIVHHVFKDIYGI